MRNSYFYVSVAYAALFLGGCETLHQTASDFGKIGGPSAQTERVQKQAVLKHCPTRHGTIAIYASKDNFWTPLGLPSPEGILKIYVMQSGCFTLVDRGKGFDVAQQERDLASGGQLRQGSNVGHGQIKAADYVLSFDITSKNSNAGGSQIAGVIGGMLGGPTVGALLSNIQINHKTADVVLTLTDVRSSEQKAMEEGHGDHTDWGFGGGAILAGPGFVGGAGVGAYQNTDVGQVVMLAYLDAYDKLIADLGYLTTDASTTSVQQAVTMAKAGHIYTAASAKAKIIRTLAVGTTLYPTGNKDGVWWEVKDELGNQGWVSSHVLSLAK